MITVILPAHLQSLAKTGKQVELDVSGDPTVASVLDALESAYPELLGTLRDRRSGARRPMVRFFVAEEDWSHEPVDRHLPDAVANGSEPFWIVGAISGG